MAANIESSSRLDLLWSELLSKKIGFSGGPNFERGRTYDKNIHGAEELVLSTDEITALSLDLLSLAKIDPAKLAIKLKGDENASIFYAAVAIRSIFETEKIYVEIPNACSSFNVPKSFVLLVLAALTGIAAQKASDWGGIATGISAGISSLLINIISSRYNSSGIPETDWIEETLLGLVQAEGQLSATEIEQRTNFHSGLVASTIKILLSKNLLVEIVDWADNKKIRYKLK
ncbi:hypothetical protein [Pseudomonas sp. NPDC087639]|uniref:hypothetical protein n=1 Tax=Pseudomonas sp. NPDC087639 TaxID=3364445 RepID=UPI0038138C59